MIAGKRASVNEGGNIFEDVYWAKYGKVNTETAYELGRQDERNGKPNVPPSPEGINARPTDSIVKPRAQPWPDRRRKYKEKINGNPTKSTSNSKYD